MCKNCFDGGVLSVAVAMSLGYIPAEIGPCPDCTGNMALNRSDGSNFIGAFHWRCKNIGNATELAPHQMLQLSTIFKVNSRC